MGRGLLLLVLAGCSSPIPTYVEDDPALVAATEQAVEDLEQYLGPTFDVRPVKAPPLHMFVNPRGGISVRLVPTPRPRKGDSRGVGFRYGYQWALVRVSKAGLLPGVVAHELCHALGLQHHPDPGNLMYPHHPEAWNLDWDQVEKLRRRADLL